MKFCNKCGTAVTEENQRFCPECGNNLMEAEASAPAPAQEAPVVTKPQTQTVAQPVAPAPAPKAEPVPMPEIDQPMNWHNFLSKQLLFAASAILVIIGILFWTGGIYQHVVFRMSDEGQFARIALNAVQGGYNDAIENPTALFDELPQVKAAMGISSGDTFSGMNFGSMQAMQSGPLAEIDRGGKQAAAMIDSLDLSFTSDYLYEQYGFMQFVDIFFGLVMIALGAAAAYLALQLAQFKKNMVKYFFFYNIAVLGSTVLYAILYTLVLNPFSDIFPILTVSFFVIVLGLVASLVYNKMYYDKREKYFVR